MLEKFAVIKKFEYSLLSKELKKQTSAAEKLYQKLDDTHEFDAIIKKKNYSKSNLINDANHNYKYYKFYRYRTKN